MGGNRDPKRFRFRGRAVELDALKELLERTARGTGGAVLVEGEPGIGKTRLADEALSGTEGIAVCRAAAQQLERDRPYGVLVDALAVDRRNADSDRAELARLMLGEEPGEGSSGEAAEARYRYRIIEGLVDLVERMAASPMALVLEDLHWSDPGTIFALHRLVRSIEHLPVAVVLTMRPTPRSPELAALIAELVEAGFRSLTLGPLDDEELRAIAWEQLGAEPGEALVRALASTGGNPLFATELTAALHEDGLIEARETTVELKAESIPRSLQITILRRLGFLSRPALEVLRFASVLGASFSVGRVAALGGQDEVSALPLIEEAVRAGLLVAEPEGFSFRHDVVRESIYLDIPQDGRRSLHGRAAEILTAAGAPPSDVAPHVVLSARPGDERAVDWLWKAGRRAALREPAVGVRLLEHALSLARESTTLVESVGSLEADLVMPLVWSGRLHDAESVAREALHRGVERETEADVRARLARGLVEEGRWAEALREFELAAEKTADPCKRARLVASIASFRYEDIEAARTLADEQGDQVALMLTLVGETFRSLESGRIEDALVFGEQAARICLDNRHPEMIGWGPHRFYTIVLQNAGLLSDARRAVADGRALANEAGMSVHLRYYGLLSATTNWLAGALDDAVADMEACFAGNDGRFADAEVLAADLVHVHVLRGDLGSARRYLDRTHGQKAPAAHRARAILHEAEGDLAAATEDVRLFAEAAVRNGVQSALLRPGQPMVRIPLAAGAVGVAKEVAAWTMEAASNTSVPRWTARAKLAAGLVEQDRDLLLEAVSLIRSTECTFEVGTVSLEAGECLLRMGETETAASLLSEALEIFERSRADRLVAQTDAALRSIGVRRGARGSRRRPRTGPDSLTDTERTVLRLIGEGATNPQIAERLFISKRTVETHIAHLFQKLEVQSRAQLIAQALRPS